MVSLLSCFVWQEKLQDAAKPRDELELLFTQLQDTARRIAKVQLECKVYYKLHLTIPFFLFSFCNPGFGFWKASQIRQESGQGLERNFGLHENRCLVLGRDSDIWSSCRCTTRLVLFGYDKKLAVHPFLSFFGITEQGLMGGRIRPCTLTFHEGNNCHCQVSMKQVFYFLGWKEYVQLCWVVLGLPWQLTSTKISSIRTAVAVLN